jgi:hypothetical protein
MSAPPRPAVVGPPPRPPVRSLHLSLGQKAPQSRGAVYVSAPVPVRASTECAPLSARGFPPAPTPCPQLKRPKSARGAQSEISAARTGFVVGDEEQQRMAKFHTFAVWERCPEIVITCSEILASEGESDQLYPGTSG